MAMAMAMAIRRYCVLYFNLSAETPEAVQQRSAKHMAFSELVSPEPMSSTPRNSSCNCVHQFSTGRQLSTPDLHARQGPLSIPDLLKCCADGGGVKCQHTAQRTEYRVFRAASP